jgi:iron complex outermembrane recepter protein
MGPGPRLLFCSLIGAFLDTPTAALSAEISVDTVIVTATRNSEDPPVVADARSRLSETPGAVAVVSSEAYANRYAQTLSDTLRDVPGVFSQKKWGDDVRLSIRGSGIGNSSHNRGTLLAQDGVPFNEADGFGDFQLIDPLIARYTEVYKGGNALRFGGALLGGAVNLVTPTGRTASSDLMLRADGGSYGTARLHAEAAAVRGEWDLFAAATALQADGWRRQSEQEVARLSLNLGRRFGEDREVRLILSGGDVRQQIPGALTLSQALAAPIQAAGANVAGDYQRNMRSVRTSLQTRWRLTPTMVLEGGAYASWKDLDHPIFQVIDQESRNWGAFGRLQWDGHVQGLKADAFAGVWLRAGDLDAQQFINVRGARGARTAASRQNAQALDLFAETRLWVTDGLAVIAGGTYGRAERDYANQLTPSANASQTFDWFAPRLGLLWQDSAGRQVFANVTRSVEPPNFSALAQTGPFTGFAPLQPQEAWTAEIGSRGRTGALTWDVALYRAEVRNELLNFIVNPAILNAGPTVHQGLEAGLDWRITPNLRLRQTYSWSDFRFDGDSQYGDARLPVAPEHLYRAELRYEHPSGWFIAPSAEWVITEVWVDYRNTLTSPAYAVVSLNAGWRLKDGLELFVDARNLADKRYISNVNAVTDARTVAATAFWPGEGRSVFGGLTWRY